MKTLAGQRRHVAKISPKLSVEFVYAAEKLDCAWDPDVPRYNHAMNRRSTMR